MDEKQAEVVIPPGLRRWFVVHFAVDVLFAVPLMVAPELMLRTLGWEQVDPVTTRLVAAALFGIGIQSLLGRNEKAEAFRGMLNLKLIWSGAAMVGIGASIAGGAPPMSWAFLGIFAVFSVLWWYYRITVFPGRARISREGG